MAKKLDVTRHQGEEVARLANDRGISRSQFQEALDNGAIAKFLDTLKTGMAPPQGARVHVVHIRVKKNREWQEAINAAGPNTPADYNVRKVGDLYLANETEEIEEDLVLLNFTKGDGSWDKARAWAQGTGLLEDTDPREVFAVVEQYPGLHQELGVNPMYVVATTECTFDGYRQACYVCWRDSDREARLRWVSHFGYLRDWFAFRKRSAKALKPQVS